MHICHIIAGLNVGGANLFLVNLLAAERQRGFQNSVIALMDEGTLGERIRSMGVPLYTLGMRRGRPSLIALRKLMQSVQQIAPDLIHAWMYHAAFATTIAMMLWRRKDPFIWNIRHTPYQLDRETLLTALLIRACGWLSRKPVAIIYNAVYSLYQHEALGYRNPRQLIIPNGFDIQRFYPRPGSRQKLRCFLGLDEGVPLIGMVARYHPMKDHITFMKAAKLLHLRKPEVQYVLIGRGVDRQNTELVERLETFGLNAHVHLLGERPDIHEILPALDLMTLTSAWGEGFPNVIGEAMACEVPCVVTDVGDAGYIVAGCGLVVEVGDEEALAQAWEELLNLDIEHRQTLGREARKRILRHFNMQNIVEQYKALYTSVCGVDLSSLN